MLNPGKEFISQRFRYLLEYMFQGIVTAHVPFLHCLLNEFVELTLLQLTLVVTRELPEAVIFCINLIFSHFSFPPSIIDILQ